MLRPGCQNSTRNSCSIAAAVSGPRLLLTISKRWDIPTSFRWTAGFASGERRDIRWLVAPAVEVLVSAVSTTMNARIFFWSLTSALAGFLFGFDTVVISGAEKTIQSLWGLSPGLHGIAMASAL